MPKEWNPKEIKKHIDLYTVDFSTVLKPTLALLKKELSGISFADEDERLTDLQDIVQNLSPESVELTKKIKTIMDDGLGFGLVKNLPIDELGAEYVKYAVSICSLIGQVTRTDRNKGIIAWEVKADPNASGNNLTFSQHNGEAELHTDSQYYDIPEKYFSLHCVKPDKFGEGVNHFVHISAIKGRILAKEDGAAILEILSSTSFPFRVPTIFTRSLSDSEIEIITKPIFSEEIPMRYRKDTIQKALDTGKYHLTRDQSYALSVLESTLEESDIKLENFLEKNDGVFANNREVMHSRTSFTDTDRMLYRIRMTE